MGWKKKDIYMKSTTIANSVKYENRAEIYCGSGKQEIREPFVRKQGWDLMENNKIGGRYTEVNVLIVLSERRNPAWVSKIYVSFLFIFKRTAECRGYCSSVIR